MGVRGFFKHCRHDGATGPNIATVYSDRGYGRSGAGRLLQPVERSRCPPQTRGDIDWKKIFAGGVRWFHTGGIFAALSATTPEVILEGDAGRQGRWGGRVVRSQLSRSFGESSRGLDSRAIKRPCGGSSPKSRSTSSSATKKKAFQKGLGIQGPEVAAKVEARFDGVFRDDRPGRQATPAKSKASRPRFARCTRRTATAGARWRGSTEQWRHRAHLRARRARSRGRGRRLRRGHDLRASRGQDAATSRRAPGGPTGLFSPPTRATPPWRRSSRSRSSPTAARRASSAERGRGR